jgi:hypothetical protein
LTPYFLVFSFRIFSKIYPASISATQLTSN